MKSPKYALQLFGHLRTYKACYPYLKKYLLNKGDFDIFIHTWDEMERKTASHFDSHIQSTKLTDSVKNDVVDMYKPCRIEFSPQQKFYPEDHNAGSSMRPFNGLRNMFYSMAKSCELRNNYEKEKNIQYDFVIVMRPDILLRSPFPLDDIVKRTKLKHFEKCLYSAPYMKEHIFFKKPNIFDYMIRATDVFFMGKPEVIDKLRMISSSDDFYDVNDQDEKTRLWGESQFANYLVQNGISQKYLTYIGSKNWRLQRTNDFKTKTEKTDFKRNFRLGKQYLKQAIKSKFKNHI